MKLNKILTSFALIAGMTLVSCSEGKYWDGVPSPEGVYGFAKPSQTVTIPSDEEMPSSYAVQVRRSTAGPEETVPVNFKTTTEFLSGAPSVTFPAGSLVAEYNIDIVPGTDAGIYYTAELTLEVSEDAPIQENKNDTKLTFSIYHEMNWVYGGTAKLSSTGQYATAEDQTVDVDVEVATNWPGKNEKMCRLVSPFHAIVPGSAEKGNDIWFILDDYNEPLKIYQPYQYTGIMTKNWDEEAAETDDALYYVFFGVLSNRDFRSKDNVFTMKGRVSLSATEGGEEFVSGSALDETLKFTWDEYDLPIDQYGK